jgi:hypothetical protein
MMIPLFFELADFKVLFAVGSTGWLREIRSGVDEWACGLERKFEYVGLG